MKIKLICFALAIVLALPLVAGCSDEREGAKVTTGSTVNTPTKYDFGAHFDEDGLLKEIDPTDYVTLLDYKGEIPEKYLASPEEEVNAQIKEILSEYATVNKLYEGVVKDGDTLNIDYVGKIDGVEFSGGNTQGRGTEVTIGVTQYIDDFLEQLIGHSAKETFDIEVTFPDDYGDASLNGKDAVFTITINYIHGDPIVPELSDDIAKDYGFDTKEEMIADIENWVISGFKWKYFTEIVENTTFSSIPTELLKLFRQMDADQIESAASMYGMTADSYLQIVYGKTLDAYLDERNDYYDDCAKQLLVSQAIAKLEGVKASNEDVEYIGAADYLGISDMKFLKAHALLNRTIPELIFGVASNSPTK